MRKKKVIVSVTTDLYSDQRVHKTCLSLNSMGYDVLLIGRKLTSSFNHLDKEPYTGNVTMHDQFGSGEIYRSPSETSKEIGAQTIGSYISGKSFER